MNKLRNYKWLLAATIALALMLTLIGSPVSMAQNRTEAGVANILINEFIATPTNSEAVELCNPTGVDVDLSGWSIDGASINDGVIVPANGYVVLDDGNTAGIGISNGGEVLKLVDHTSATIDQVGYGKAGGIYNTMCIKRTTADYKFAIVYQRL
jgi:predicted extracellular nuclease